MNKQFDILLVTDNYNCQTNVRHLFIIEEDWQTDSEVKYIQIVHAIEIHLPTVLHLTEKDLTSHQSQVIHVQCRLI